jgi:SAM-dependent methyltransferase/uncharacterized protein YbaR (Trm112 family)
MNSDTVALLRCPACEARPLNHMPLEVGPDGETLRGFLWCGACRNWFPVEDGVLDLLHGTVAYEKDRARFWDSHEKDLRALGLGAGTDDRSSVEAEAVRKQQEHFDWYADNEQQTYSDYEATPFWRAADAVAFGEWRREVRAGARLLDVACAQGRSTFHWIDLDLNIFAFDISKPLIRQARDRFRRARARARAEFFVADATRFPFKPGIFDYVVTYGVLHHLPDPAGACGEILRVLRPGGVFFGSENNTTAFRGVFDLLQKVWPQWHEEAGAHPLISEREIRTWLQPHHCKIAVRSSVFLPPHAVNLLSERAAESVLRWVDRLAAKMPGLRQQGGLLLFRAEKSGGAARS